MHAPFSAPAAELAEVTAALLTRLRQRTPLVHSITNGVVQGFTANVLLALGAAPAMVDITGEAGAFAAAADGLLINLGTPAPEQRDAMREAVAGATAAGTPWVLDPVAIGSLPIRTALAHELVALRPTAVRGNASEVLALAGLGAGGRGTDAADAGAAALPAARKLAVDHGSVVAISGPEDLIHGAGGTLRVFGGDPLLTRVTGGGCALGAVVAAFLAVRGDEAGAAPDAAAVAAAHAVYGLAASAAAEVAAGPGSFAVQLIDELSRLTPERVREAARIEEWDPSEEGGEAAPSRSTAGTSHTPPTITTGEASA
ncbi:hydroxyethylthiazole kinase [Leucobacter komagatae]|uniref:hydroxyethylthiazole kinase n=1 Tax=Leucobacter komagatae TaxID=55969 RepID=UPI0005ABC304|nr:hydroxyethylthiazole kinase [Leucobacter komagatae]